MTAAEKAAREALAEYVLSPGGRAFVAEYERLGRTEPEAIKVWRNYVARAYESGHDGDCTHVAARCPLCLVSEYEAQAKGLDYVRPRHPSDIDIQDLLDAERVKVARLVDAVRALEIDPPREFGPGRMCCDCCGTDWPDSEPEQHHDACPRLAALAVADLLTIQPEEEADV